MNPLNIPEKHQKLILTALQKATGHASFSNITQLLRGMSRGCIYKVEASGHVYVARISAQNHWGDELTVEFKNMQIASVAKICPQIHSIDPDAGMILMEYIDAKPLTQLETGDRNEAQSLAKLVSRIHHCVEFGSGARFFKIAIGILQNLSLECETHYLISQVGSVLEQLEPLFDDPKDLRPSHRDINPYNLLFDGSDYYLVDWEASAQDSLYLDLAICVNFYFHSNAETACYFLEQYFGNELNG